MPTTKIVVIGRRTLFLSRDIIKIGSNFINRLFKIVCIVYTLQLMKSTEVNRRSSVRYVACGSLWYGVQMAVDFLLLDRRGGNPGSTHNDLSTAI